MKLTGIILVFCLFLLAGCSSSRETISSSKGDSVTERCAAINSQFTNGTPMSQIEAMLGRPDTMIITTTLSWPPETQNQRIWVYHFGPEDILVSSTGGPTTPLDQRGFAGARVVRKTQ
jgi:uncharacterized protein YceK